jgi:ribosome-associated protein
MEEPKSKSQKKREADALQKLGVEFIGLSLEKLNALPLSDHLRQAILQAKSLKSHGAIRRQAQLIGKLMRSEDSDDILVGYEGMLAQASAKTAEFHDVEQWRERLIKEGKEALTGFISAYPQVEVQQLRQLIKKAVDEQQKGLHTGASKALFRFLRSFII